MNNPARRRVGCLLLLDFSCHALKAVQVSVPTLVSMWKMYPFSKRGQAECRAMFILAILNLSRPHYFWQADTH